jgi:hypothetical protein
MSFNRTSSFFPPQTRAELLNCSGNPKRHESACPMLGWLRNLGPCLFGFSVSLTEFEKVYWSYSRCRSRPSKTSSCNLSLSTTCCHADSRVLETETPSFTAAASAVSTAKTKTEFVYMSLLTSVRPEVWRATKGHTQNGTRERFGLSLSV